MRKPLIFLSLLMLFAWVVPARAQTLPGAIVIASGQGYIPGDHRPIREQVLAPLILVAGSQLQFLNRDTVNLHSLTSLEGDDAGLPRFDSGLTASNQIVAVTGTDLLEPGEYRFACVIHYDPGAPALSMEGFVTVVGAG